MYTIILIKALKKIHVTHRIWQSIMPNIKSLSENIKRFLPWGIKSQVNVDVRGKPVYMFGPYNSHHSHVVISKLL